MPQRGFPVETVPRQRTGLDSVAPLALCAWTALKSVDDCDFEEVAAPRPYIEVDSLTGAARSTQEMRGSPIPFKLICGGACSSTVRAADS